MGSSLDLPRFTACRPLVVKGDDKMGEGTLCCMGILVEGKGTHVQLSKRIQSSETVKAGWFSRLKAARFHSWMCGFVAYDKNPDNNTVDLTHRSGTGEAPHGTCMRRLAVAEERGTVCTHIVEPCVLLVRRGAGGDRGLRSSTGLELSRCIACVVDIRIESFLSITAVIVWTGPSILAWGIVCVSGLVVTIHVPGARKCIGIHGVHLVDMGRVHTGWDGSSTVPQLQALCHNFKHCVTTS